MKYRRLNIVFGILLTFVILLCISFFIFFSDKKISISNNSKHYLVTHQESALFTKYLNEWRIWDKNEIRINKQAQIYTVKKIKINITEEPQTLYRFFSYPDVNNIIISENAIVKNDGTWVISVYINPIYANKNDINNVNNVFLWMILRMIVTNSQESATPNNTSDEVSKVYGVFTKQKQDWPFVVEIKDEK